MSFKLLPSLTNVGGVIVEGYRRVTRASPEEKARLGKLPTEEVFANVGVASIEEYIIMNVTDVSRGESAVFNLTQFDQPMRLVSLYIDEPNNDTVTIQVFLPDDTLVLSQGFGRHRTPVAFPPAPLPNNVKIKVKAMSDTKFIQIVLIPVIILESLQGKKEKSS